MNKEKPNLADILDHNRATIETSFLCIIRKLWKVEKKGWSEMCFGWHK